MARFLDLQGDFGAAALQRIRHRYRKQSAHLVISQLIHQSFELRLSQAGPRSIVHQYPVSIIYG